MSGSTVEEISPPSVPPVVLVQLTPEDLMWAGFGTQPGAEGSIFGIPTLPCSALAQALLFGAALHSVRLGLDVWIVFEFPWTVIGSAPLEALTLLLPVNVPASLETPALPMVALSQTVSRDDSVVPWYLSEGLDVFSIWVLPCCLA